MEPQMARISRIRKKLLEFASLHSHRISDSCLLGFLIIILSDWLRLRRVGFICAYLWIPKRKKKRYPQMDADVKFLGIFRISLETIPGRKAPSFRYTT